MSNSNLPTEFIKILKNELPPDILNKVINNLPNELAQNPKLAKSIKKIEETFNSKSKQIKKKIEKFKETKPKPEKTPSPIIEPITAPITLDQFNKLPKITKKPKIAFTSIYTPTNEFKKPKTIPFDGKPPVPFGAPILASDPLSATKQIDGDTSTASIDYELGKPEVKSSVPKTGSFTRNDDNPEKKKKKTDAEKVASLEKKEAEIKKKELELKKKEADIMKKIESGIVNKIDEIKKETTKNLLSKQKEEKKINDKIDQKINEKINEKINQKTNEKTNEKTNKKKGKQIFTGKSLPEEIQKLGYPSLDSLKYDEKLDNNDKQTYKPKQNQINIIDTISSLVGKPINAQSVGQVLQSISGISGLFPNVIYNLSIQQLVNYSLKAFGDFFIDISLNITNLSIAKVIELLLKENRILYIGIGLFMITSIMYIFNNFIKIPLSFAGLLGITGDKRVFINNY
jgi:hypothetical protein